MLEIFVKNFSPENVNGYYQEQNDKSHLWVLKENYMYIDYFGNKKIVYESGNFRNRITSGEKK